MPDGTTPSIASQEADPNDTQEAPTGLRSILSRFLGPKTVGLDGMLQNGGPNGTTLSAAEREMIERVVSFDKKRVDDVAIPRADIVGVAVDAELPFLLRTFSEANHSRLPVYRGELDDPIGMVHIKDVVGLLAETPTNIESPPKPILESIRRPILYVPPSMPVTDLLLRMQASRVHMALVIDEFGGTDGLVTIEDLIELIVGDIRDEHDDEVDFEIKHLSEGKWDIDARTPLEDLAASTGINVDLGEHDADTIGGLVFCLAGRVPLRGEVISHPDGHEFEIRDADPRRVRRIFMRKGTQQSPMQTDAPHQIDSAGEK